MKNIPIPVSGRKKALLLIDMQEGFLKEGKETILTNLVKLFEQQSYDLYVQVTFETTPGSLWEKQIKWKFLYEPAIKELEDLLRDKPVEVVKKSTRSAFKGYRDLHRILESNNVTENHIVGVDSTDCVYATAQESFDLGYFTYVIEECTCASQGEYFHRQAISLLRRLGLTNHDANEPVTVAE